jgi:hypothetical protein
MSDAAIALRWLVAQMHRAEAEAAVIVVGRIKK